jgi:hypothetical protein
MQPPVLLLAAALLMAISAAPASAGTPAAPAAQAYGLSLDVYTNGALGGRPASSVVIGSLDNVSLPGGAEPFSAEITGTVRLLRNETHAFSCAASQAITLLLLHVGDHLVCQRGGDGGGAGDVYTLSADTLVFRMTVYGNGTAAAQGSGNWVSVGWAKGAHPHAAGAAAAAAAPAAAAAAAATAEATPGETVLGYTRWPIQNIDTVHNLPCPSPGCSAPPGVSDNSSQTLADCIALCDALAHNGCIGFVTRLKSWTNKTGRYGPLTSERCYLRGTAVNCPSGNCAPRPQLPCADLFQPTASSACGGASRGR